MKQLLELEPDNARANYEAAETYFQLGERTQATRYIKAALKSEPNNRDFEATLNKLLKNADDES